MQGIARAPPVSSAVFPRNLTNQPRRQNRAARSVAASGGNSDGVSSVLFTAWDFERLPEPWFSCLAGTIGKMNGYRHTPILKKT